MSSTAVGRSLELYFIDGRPDGMLTAEVFNWTGHLLVAPRTQLNKALSRTEARYTGVYILLGEQEGEPLAYVGEGESIRDRLKNHDTNKDWWNTAVFVTSAGNKLHKAHVKYLEARLVEEARKVGKTRLENGNTPARPSLPEPQVANMEGFLEHLFMVLPAVRIDMFLKATRPSKPVEESSKADLVFVLKNKLRGLEATAVFDEEAGELVVQAGSLAQKDWTSVGTENSTYGKLHSELVASGVLVEDGDHRIFSANTAFRSPSAAAAVINGRPANGPQDWKVPSTNQTYKEWEQSRLAGSTEGDV